MAPGHFIVGFEGASIAAVSLSGHEPEVCGVGDGDAVGVWRVDALLHLPLCGQLAPALHLHVRGIIFVPLETMQSPTQRRHESRLSVAAVLKTGTRYFDFTVTRLG